MAQENRAFDVVILGGGPGGYVAAMRASQLGMQVALIEREALGGICVNWGCIPSKAILRSAEVLRLIHEAQAFGITVDGVKADYAKALKRSRDIAERQHKGVIFLMRKYKVEVVQGTGRLTARDRIAVTAADGQFELQARKGIIIATGSRVRPLPGMRIDGKRIISSREVWNVEDMPGSMILLGAGPIGCEFATAFSAFGVKVTLVEALPRVLPREDPDCSAIVTREFKRRGIDVVTGMSLASAEAHETGVHVRLQPTPPQPVQVWGNAPKMEAAGDGPVSPAGLQELEADRVLLSAGFTPNVEDIGLEQVGVALERGYIRIDEHTRTSVPGVYAIGDVTGKLALAHVAEAQGMVAAEAVAGKVRFPLDYSKMPRATFSDPQVASLGLTEEEAQQQGIAYKAVVSPFLPNGKARAMSISAGQVKLLVAEKTGEIIGAHMVGPEVTELIHEVVLARVFESTPLELGRAVHAHPTLSETVAEAALEWAGMPIAS
jgi:dihydrolipoamide dehydrogenase